MQVCIEQVKKHALDIFYNGGRFIEQFGLFQECKQAQLQYSLSLFLNKRNHNPSGLYIGLCLPKQCTQDIIKQGLDAFLSGANLPYITGDIIYDPQNIVAEKVWLFYPVIIFLILLVICTIVATGISRFPKYRDHPSLPLRLLSSFNFYQTVKIFTYKKNVFNVFNGVKSICMFWVIFGHQFSTRLKNAVNLINIPSHIQTWFFLFVIGAFFAVDVFFFIGGFLVAYSFLRQKSKSPLKYPFAIIHRILRFWPSYITAISIFYALLMHTGYGPFWWQSYGYAQISDCQDFWKPIFFVDNLVDNGQKMCLPWGWYLQNDMQIFIFSMIYLFVYSKNKILTKFLIIGTIGVSLIINFTFTQSKQYIQVTHLEDFAKWNQYFPGIYIKPWTRCPPYLIGLFFGLQYMEYLADKKQIQHQHSHHKRPTSINYDEQQKNAKNQKLSPHIYCKLAKQLSQSKLQLYTFQIIGLGIMLFVLLIPRTLQLGNIWPQTVHSLYLSAGKVFFVLGLYIMILPSLLDIPNMTFFLMDTRFFNFISKISFWTYLIHYMIIVQIAYSQKVDFYYTVQDILPIYCPIAVLSLFFGLIGTILVQVPFAKIQKMLMNKAMGKKQDRKIQKIGSITQPLVQSISSSVKVGSIVSQQGNNINRSIKT